MPQLFAIQSCPILHGPVIVFDSRDVEILKNLGVSSIANENTSASSDYSLVRDVEEAKDSRKGEFSITKQLPDILPRSMQTTAAARVLKNRRRVPFQHKTCNNYTQVMKYLKSSPPALEILEGRQFVLAKPTVGPSIETAVTTKPPNVLRNKNKSLSKNARVSPPVHETIPSNDAGGIAMIKDQAKEESAKASKEGTNKKKKNDANIDKEDINMVEAESTMASQEDTAMTNDENTKANEEDTNMATEDSVNASHEGADMTEEESAKASNIDTLMAEDDSPKANKDDTSMAKEDDASNINKKDSNMAKEDGAHVNKEGSNTNKEDDANTNIAKEDDANVNKEKTSTNKEDKMDTNMANGDDGNVNKEGTSMAKEDDGNVHREVNKEGTNLAKGDDDNVNKEGTSVAKGNVGNVSKEGMGMVKADGANTNKADTNTAKEAGANTTGKKNTDETPRESDEARQVKNVGVTDDDHTSKQDEVTKTRITESVPQGKADVPQKPLPSPVNFQDAPAPIHNIAELIKIRKRVASTPKTSPIIALAATAAPPSRKRGKPPGKGSQPAKKRGRPPKHKSLPQVEQTQATGPPNLSSTVPVGIAVPAPKKRGRPPKVRPLPTSERTTALPNPSAVNLKPAKKRGRPPKVKPAVVAVPVGPVPTAAQVPSPAVAAPQAAPAVEAVAVPPPVAKKRGRPPKAKTTDTAGSPSPPPTKSGRPPTLVDTTTATAAPVPAQLSNLSTDTPSNEGTTTPTPPTIATTTNETNTTARAVGSATATDALVLSPPRKPQGNMADEPCTPGNATLSPNSTSDTSSIGELLTPVIESPITSPAGSEHFSTRNAGATWNEKFLELFRYKMQYGNCNVLAKDDDSTHKALGEWVRIQRKRKNGKSKSLKPLSMEEEAKLNAIGFNWKSATKLVWDDRYRQLVKYKMKCGNANVPLDYKKDPTLATWCATQRKRWRQKLQFEEKQNGDQSQEFTVDANGKKRRLPSPMTDEEEGKLLALGFEF
ncbi:unnamed protein product [Cylindrotheca closterium]|uniref:Helicase-associated domain-containing protein n=1 Tax=Cylindrotheca closterium TaxID=2856 RepID=A0AAD2JN55_9STRA|nr:unnamed protein product [Cylindrotheca closterium]